MGSHGVMSLMGIGVSLVIFTGEIMPHPTHKLSAYCGDPHRKTVFCTECGQEESEGLEEPCTNKFYQKVVDTPKPKPYRPFVSGLYKAD